MLRRFALVPLVAVLIVATSPVLSTNLLKAQQVPPAKEPDKTRDQAPPGEKDRDKAKTEPEGELPPGYRKVMKTDAEWRKVLTRAQYEVTRNKATELPFSGRYAVSHARGTYLCVCCGAELFSSQNKFDSGTGWPSFYRPIDPRRVETALDNHLAELRVEVLCRDCGAHLGHVFEDGPPPTGLRFCINSLSLKFASPNAPKETPVSKSRSRAKGKTPSRPEPKPADEGSAEPSR